MFYHKVSSIIFVIIPAVANQFFPTVIYQVIKSFWLKKISTISSVWNWEILPHNLGRSSCKE